MSVSRAILGVLFCFVVLLNFLAVDAQKQRDVCSQPRLVGHCRAMLRRYYYDSTSKACKQFYYGGCGGNGNNFVTRSHCKAACVN